MSERPEARTTPEERGQIIRQLRLAAGLGTAEQLAQKLGVHRGYVSKLERGTVDVLNVTPGRFHALAAALNVSSTELLGLLGCEVPDPPVRRDQVVFTPMRAVPGLGHVSAGPVTDPEAHPSLPLPSAWHHGNLRFVVVEGDSMRHPLKRGILHGDTVLVDVSEVNPAEGRVFMVRSDVYGLCVKRLRCLDGRWWAFSDNPDYPPFPLDESANVVGRFRYVLNLYSDE